MDSFLDKFVSFVKQQGSSHITTEIALQWATRENAQTITSAKRLQKIRGFAQYRANTDMRTEVPSRGLIPRPSHRNAPYIYTEGEIKRLIAAAKTLPSAVGLLPYTYSTLLGLFAVTGLRHSEAIGLNRTDVDLRQGLLTIRETKFGKSRLVPIHKSTQSALEEYARRRDIIHRQPKAPSFFLSDSGKRVASRTLNKVFCELSHKIGLRGPSDRRGPRLHDLRHTFVVRTLVRWYRAGVDVDRHMPELSTYIGHARVISSYWYISAVPELLRLAIRRLERGISS
ncbi:MAG: tyrosine-type recombinase/integrase [Elusimicrobiota bacterium]|nr:tyrosine-type recombinase/integrase [Elusimicrobiota bacterium]